MFISYTNNYCFLLIYITLILHLFTDTTDLQSISVAQHESDNSIVVQCTFIKGSDARGCRVILFNLYNTNTTNVRNLTREMDSLCASTQVTNETFLLSEYDEVYGYDIESDWSTGYVRVHGQILPNESEVLPCTPGAIAISPSELSGFI